MIVELRDGCCRTCGSTLRVIDADDVTMTVSCLECRDIYLVEPDAFGDGGEKYYAEFLVTSLRHRRKGGEQSCTPTVAEVRPYPKGGKCEPRRRKR